MAPKSALPRRGLDSSDGLLRERHDLLLVDLDGVAYLGEQPIDGAAEALTAARAAGARLVFVTNNAARPPKAVADQLVSIGIAATIDEVMTSAIAAAQALASRHPAAAPVLVVGGAGIRDALVELGLAPVDTADEHPVAVLQGFAPEVGWHALAEATVAIRAGAEWVATNADATLPSPRGPLPGNGSLVAAIAMATGLQPEVIGKPEPALFDAALKAGRGSSRPLVIGDRLDTDIVGATAAGLPSLLVLSGVSRAVDLLLAAPPARPHYIGRDLGALGIDHPTAEVRDGVARCGGATATMADDAARVDASAGAAEATATPDGLDGLRALCALAWDGPSSGGSDAGRASRKLYDNALSDLHLN